MDGAPPAPLSMDLTNSADRQEGGSAAAAAAKALVCCIPGKCCGRGDRSLDEPMVAPARGGTMDKTPLPASSGASLRQLGAVGTAHTANPVAGAGVAQLVGGGAAAGGTAQPHPVGQRRRARGRRPERWAQGRLVRHTAEGREGRVARAVEVMNRLIQAEEPLPQRCRTVLIQYSSYASADDVRPTWLALQQRLKEIEASEQRRTKSEERMERKERRVVETWSAVFASAPPYTGPVREPPPQARYGVAEAQPQPEPEPEREPEPELPVPGLELAGSSHDEPPERPRERGRPSPRDGVHHLEHLRKARWRSAEPTCRGRGRANPYRPSDDREISALSDTPESPELAAITGTDPPALRLTSAATGATALGPGASAGMSMRKVASFESRDTFGLTGDSALPVLTKTGPYLATVRSVGSDDSGESRAITEVGTPPLLADAGTPPGPPLLLGAPALYVAPPPPTTLLFPSPC